MYCIGLTGNIASGKSTAIACFQSLNIETISADAIAKELTAPTQPAFFAITNYFGKTIVTAEGELNRVQLRKLIFSNEIHRKWLEDLLHPLIRTTIMQKISTCKSPYCVIEIPLLTSREEYSYLDRILVILAKKELQIERVMKRDHCDSLQALTILSTQPSEAARRQLADDLFINNGSLEKFITHIKNLHKKYLHLASKKTS